MLIPSLVIHSKNFDFLDNFKISVLHFLEFFFYITQMDRRTDWPTNLVLKALCQSFKKLAVVQVLLSVKLVIQTWVLAFVWSSPFHPQNFPLLPAFVYFMIFYQQSFGACGPFLRQLCEPCHRVNVFNKDSPLCILELAPGVNIQLTNFVKSYFQYTLETWNFISRAWMNPLFSEQNETEIWN